MGAAADNSGVRHSRAKPCGEFQFADSTRGDRLHDSDGIRWTEAQRKSVVGKKETGSHPCRAFVAIGKTVASRQTVRICGGEGGGIRGLVGCEISWMRQCRFHAADIQNAGRPTMFSNLAVMDCVQYVGANPSPALHRESAFKISRSSCMMSSASSIWRSKSGLYGVSR